MARKYKYDQYIFLDSDTIILKEPCFFLNTTYDVSLSPVFSKGVGIHGKTDKNFAYWQNLYRIAGSDVENIPRVKTIFEGDEIFGYWNAGVIAINGESGIFKRWNAMGCPSSVTYADFSTQLIEIKF